MDKQGVLSDIEEKCRAKNLKMTGQRKTIAEVIARSDDHPTAEDVYDRASQIDDKISLATVYRTLKLFEEENILQSLEFGDGRSRFEPYEDFEDHHHHLIDLESGKIIEFRNDMLEDLKVKIAKELGYKLVDHRLELFGVPLDSKTSDKKSQKKSQKKI